EHLARLGPEETQRLFESADRHMRDAGVVHRVYDDPGGVDRPWPLSHLPLVLPADDWRALAEGIAQRARLHEALLTDLYGEQAVVK
ncbi:circularly permuted type 2 ATP-grasp protein, partial [Acinetobacter baumannii]